METPNQTQVRDRKFYRELAEKYLLCMRRIGARNDLEYASLDEGYHDRYVLTQRVDGTASSDPTFYNLLRWNPHVGKYTTFGIFDGSIERMTDGLLRTGVRVVSRDDGAHIEWRIVLPRNEREDLRETISRWIRTQRAEEERRRIFWADSSFVG